MATKYEFYDEAAPNVGNTVGILDAVDGPHKYEQGFTPQEDFVCTKVRLDFIDAQVNLNDSEAYVQLFVGEGSGGSLLATATARKLTTLTFPGWNDFDFPTLPVLEASTQYAIKVRCLSGGTETPDYFRWFGKNDGVGYAGGECWHVTDMPEIWTEYPNEDKHFETWGGPPALGGAMGKARGFELRGRGFRP